MSKRFWLIAFLIYSLLTGGSFIFGLETLEGETITTEEELDELLSGAEIAQDVYDEYRYLFTQPLELNSATYSEFLTLPYVDPPLARLIIKERNKKPFSAVIEVKEILGETVYQAIRPLVTVTPPPQEWHFWGRVEVNDDFEDEEKADTFIRLRGSYGQNYFYGLRGEGEEKIYGFDYHDGDFYADEPQNRFTLKKAYFGLENIGLLERFVFGSYSLRFGRGVTLNSAHRRQGEGIFYDYDSAERYIGAAGSWRLGRFINPTLFFSDQERKESVSAYLDGVKARGLPRLYHEKVWGGRMELRLGEENRLGYTFFQEQAWPHEEITLSGFEEMSELAVSGGDFQFRFKDALLGGEFSQVARGEGAYYLDVLAQSPRYSFYSAYRHYPEDYLNPQGYGIASADDEPNASDEVGYFLELKNKFNRSYTLITSFDQWRHPSSLITDREISTTLTARPIKKLRATLKYRAKDTDVFKSGSRYYYSSFKPQLTLDKRLLLTLFYQLREFYSSKEVRELDDSYYGMIRLTLPHKVVLQSRLKYYVDNRGKADEERMSREVYWQLRSRLARYFSALIKYTISEQLIPTEYPQTRYKFQLDWRY